MLKKRRNSKFKRKTFSFLILLAVFLILETADKNVYGQSVKLYPSVIRVEKGKTKTITAFAKNTNNGPVFDATFTFNNPNTSVASLTPARFGVSAENNVYSPPNLRTIEGLSVGTTTVTASWFYSKSNSATSNSVTIIVDDPSLSPTAIIHGDNDASGGGTINTKVGEPIEINADSSQGVHQIEWSWGDGDKTTDLFSATHAYLESGTYSLTLKITNSNNVSTTSTVTVNVSPQSAPTQTIIVTTAQQLLNAYNNATGGEHIIIPAGSVIETEGIRLPARNFTDYVTIRSSGTMPNLHTRISNNDAGLATIRSNTSDSSLSPLVIENGASKIRIVGIKVDPKHNIDETINKTYLIEIGESDSQTSITQNPTKIIFEHCVINPPDNISVANGFLNDGYKVAIIATWIGNIKSINKENHGILSISGKGAHVYNNTFIEAASINIFYGGAVPGTVANPIDGLTPQNIEIRRSHLFKRLSWRNRSPGVNIKNIFETKNARRVYMEGSILENHWDSGASQKFAINIKSAVLPGTKGEYVPWAVSEEIVFENNKVNHMYGGIGTTIDTPEPYIGLKPNNIIVKNTLFDDISALRWGLPGIEQARLLQINNVEDFRISHVTVIDKDLTAQEGVMLISNNNFRFNIEDSIINLGSYGIKKDEGGIGGCALNEGTGGISILNNGICIKDNDAEWNVRNNVMPKYPYEFVERFPNQAPYINFYPEDFDEIDFIDLANGDYRISPSSIYSGIGSGGSDPGANIPLLNQKTDCTVSGIITPLCRGISSQQTSYPGPTIPIPIKIEAENFDKGGQNTAYNDTFGTTGSSAYRSGPVEAVDIRADSNASNGYEIFEAAAGEWYEYTINVPTTRNYDISVRYANAHSNGTFHIEIDGVDVSGTMTAASTGGWTAFRRVTKRGVSLSAGTHVLRLRMDINSSGGCNCVVADFDSILFTPTQFDFDGDGLSDISVFRPLNNTWYSQQSTAGISITTPSFALSGDIIVPGDFDGDGKTDIAHWQSGNWKIIKSSNNALQMTQFGLTGDIPVPADFDGDGKSDIAVFRPSDSTWYILNSSGGTAIQQFGASGDRPVAADYDGDGKADLAIFRPADGSWWINYSSTQTTSAYSFGMASDKTVPADYTGDGKADIALWRPSSGEWLILRSENASYYSFPFGISGDIPSPADYDGDGIADAAVFRPSTGVWHFVYSVNISYSNYAFGVSGDIPIPSVYVR